MDTTTLATFRIDKKTWKQFKKWAGNKNSNASAELNQFILKSLGCIDESQDINIDGNLEKRIENYIDNNIDNRIEKLVNQYLDNNIDKYIYNVVNQSLDKDQKADTDTNLDNNIDNNIDKEESLEESLQQQSNEQLSHAELARRMNVSSSTVSRWATKKCQPPKNFEWRYDPKLKKWVK